MSLLEAVVEPLGGLIGRTAALTIHPGEPRFSIYMASLGDLSRVLPNIPKEQRGESTAGHLDGAGGSLEPAEARVRAIAEAVERYSCCVYSQAQFIWATARELGAEALDLDSIPSCSEAELSHPKCPVVAPMKEAPMRWVRGISLKDGRAIWLPAVMVYLHIEPKSVGERFWLPISTGCAAHVTIEQALIGAICEVVERDAISLTWYQQLALPRLELDSITPELMPFVDRLQRSDVQQFFFDATTDVGVPTVYSVQVSPQNAKLAALVMCATDLDPVRAVAKVMRESASSRLAMQATKQYHTDLDHFIHLVDGAMYMGQPERLEAYDFLLHSPATRNLSQMPTLETGDHSRDLVRLVDHLHKKGLDLYAVDLTTDEALRAGIRVVRVIVPQLMPLSFAYRARYLGHPRLYQAPAAMGYGVRSELQLNPRPQPFA